MCHVEDKNRVNMINMTQGRRSSIVTLVENCVDEKPNESIGTYWINHHGTVILIEMEYHVILGKCRLHYDGGQHVEACCFNIFDNEGFDEDY